jgi:hypothetical protein
MEPMITQQSFVLHTGALLFSVILLCVAVLFHKKIDQFFDWCNTLWTDEFIEEVPENEEQISMHTGSFDNHLCMCAMCMRERYEKKLQKSIEQLGKRWLLAVPKCRWCMESPTRVCSLHKQTREFYIPKSMRDQK